MARRWLEGAAHEMRGFQQASHLPLYRHYIRAHPLRVCAFDLLHAYEQEGYHPQLSSSEPSFVLIVCVVRFAGRSSARWLRRSGAPTRSGRSSRCPGPWSAASWRATSRSLCGRAYAGSTRSSNRTSRLDLRGHSCQHLLHISTGRRRTGDGTPPSVPIIAG